MDKECPYHKVIHTNIDHPGCVRHGHCLYPGGCPLTESCPSNGPEAKQKRQAEQLKKYKKYKAFVEAYDKK